MNGLEIYNDILDNTHNLKGTWEVTEDNYLNVTGNTNGSIVLFDKTVGALGDFILEWTAEQKGGSYIHSNLCPSLRYTPEDAGIEGGGDNYAMLVYLCNYGGNPGTFNLRTEGGTKSTVNTSGVSLNLDTVYTFKLERLGGTYRLYQDGVLINEATDITKKKLYLGWYLWYGGTNSSYQTNFILREYNLTKIDTKSYLDTIGLTSLWSKIKSLFATKTELGSKANDADVVHKSGDAVSGDLRGNGSNNLGTSTNKWKTINGINPGSLGFPAIEFIDYSSSVPSGNEVYIEAPADGWFMLNAYCQSGTKFRCAVENVNLGLEFVTGNIGYHTSFCPIQKGKRVALCVTGTHIFCRFFSCQGNV